jgi:hypothetical protein
LRRARVKAIPHVIIKAVNSVFCCITYPDRTGFNTIGTSIFDAAAKALRWVEITRREFGTARRFRDDQILVIGVGMVPDRWYRVKVGRVREWVRERSKPNANFCR